MLLKTEQDEKLVFSDLGRTCFAEWHNVPAPVQKDPLDMPTRNVVVTDHEDSPVDRPAKSGRYQNAGEVVREGLRSVEREDAEGGARIEALRDAAQAGMADVKARRIQSVDSAEELYQHFGTVAAGAIESAHDRESGH
ncbi:type II toxin-antitoxin system ParD family antitoxin [Paraburkholderia sp. 40]|uniref:type II toxin-antitoxin system ParD family antitoxin n=1 Tax=Paraburkholderia sp. 40 TaxID=2991059 RepID=UPI003D225357